MKQKRSSLRTGGQSRREFIAKTVGYGLGAMALPQVVPSTVLGAQESTAPNDRICLGMIGTGNQGTNDMRAFLRDERVQVVAVCDLNRESAGYWNGAVAGRLPARRIVEKYYGEQRRGGNYKGCAMYDDFRDLLARRDIDVVAIATPDHWHAVPVVEACKAGKDMYCQKPLSLTIKEGRIMSNTVRHYNRIFQCGSQQRSNRNFRHACELVRNGRIGKLVDVKVGLPSGRPDFGKTGDRKKPERVPEGFNYEMWLGQAPRAPYAPARCFVNFRWIYDYSGGQVTDWGGHHPDIAQWGMDTEYTGPIAIQNPKGVFPPDPLWNTATEYHFECLYESGVRMTISDKNRMGVRFEGTDGWVWVSRGGHETHPKSLWESEIGPNEIHLYRSDNHYRNFIDCVLSRQEPIAPVEIAHRSITLGHLGNIAMLLGRELKWNPKEEQIEGDPVAQWMLNRPARAPWRLPT